MKVFEIIVGRDTSEIGFSVEIDDERYLYFIKICEMKLLTVKGLTVTLVDEFTNLIESDAKVIDEGHRTTLNLHAPIRVDDMLLVDVTLDDAENRYYVRVIEE